LSILNKNIYPAFYILIFQDVRMRSESLYRATAALDIIDNTFASAKECTTAAAEHPAGE
jgi:hypothetical protein